MKKTLSLILICIALTSCGVNPEKLKGDVISAKDNLNNQIKETKQAVDDSIASVNKTVDDVKKTAESIKQAADDIKKAKDSVDEAMGNIKTIGQ